MGEELNKMLKKKAIFVANYYRNFNLYEKKKKLLYK
jgi:hypothetical protein